MPFSISNNEYAAFQCRIFDRWISLNDPGVRIRHIDSIVRGLFGAPVRSCIYAGTCQRFINVGSNGDVFPCERLTTAVRLGNLYESTLSDILRQLPYREHAATTQELPSECRQCRYLNVCRNGCTHHRVSGKLYFCKARLQVFRHIEGALKGILKAGGANNLVPLTVASE
jgi:uncharacterized protein